MHIAILMTNTDESAFAQRHPKDGDKFRTLLAPLRPAWRFSVYPVKDGVFPDSIDAFDGIVITGSPASVRDDAPWITRLLHVIRDAAARGVPLFGACFGHQAIALALGGTVGDNPGDFVLGTVEARIRDAAPWMAPAPRRVALYAAHGEQVTALPAGARVIAEADDCEFAGFTLDERIFTTEYHPEMTPDFVAALVDELADKLPAPVIARARSSLARQADTALFAGWIVQFFEHVQA